MNRSPAKPTSPAMTLAVLLGGLAIGTALVVVSVREMVASRALGTSAITVEARVTDSRVMTYRKRGDSYEVRYAFEVGDRTYRFRDATGRDDLWAVLDADAWKSAQRTRTVTVQYLPSDPRVNRAVHEADDKRFGQVAGIVTGFLCMAPALLALVAAIRRRQPSS